MVNKPLFIFYQNPSTYNAFLLFSVDAQVLCLEAYRSDKASPRGSMSVTSASSKMQ